jgi:hypothetical protein
MKSTHVSIITFALIIAFTMFSCKEVRYTYYLENATLYDLDSASLDFYHRDFALARGERIGPFHHYHKENPAYFFGQSLLVLNVSQITDGDSTYAVQSSTVRDTNPIKDGGVYIFRIRQLTEDTTTVRFGFGIETVPQGSALISKLP